MGKALELPIKISKALSRKLHRRAEPALEGKTWAKCAVCGRPVFDTISRARKIGPVCFKRQMVKKQQANYERAQRDLSNQLTLFPNASVQLLSPPVEVLGIDPLLGF